MPSVLTYARDGAAVLVIAVVLAAAVPTVEAVAQAPAPASTGLPASTIRALQEALKRQGITVTADGVLNDETRAAIRKYQSQHHLPVTGEPDQATLDKLGVRQSRAPGQLPRLVQAVPTGSRS